MWTVSDSLWLMAILLIIVIVGTYHWVYHSSLLVQRNVHNKLLTYLGIGWLCYFCGARYFFSIVDLINTVHDPFIDQYYRSLAYSKVLLLDLCPFLAVVMFIGQIFIKKINFQPHLAVISIFSGSVTLFSFRYLNLPHLSFGLIFLGIGPNRLYYLMHLMLVVYGVLILLTYGTKFIWQDFHLMIVIGASFLLYAYLLAHIFHVQYNVSGLVPNDWAITNGYQGEYFIAQQLFDLPFPQVYGYLILWSLLGCGLIMLLHNFRLSLIRWIYWKKQWFSMIEPVISPISKYVDYPNKHQMHWEGHLSFKTFFSAYWKAVWTDTSLIAKLCFISFGFFILFFPSILFQFVFKKSYCLGLRLYQQITKKPAIKPQASENKKLSA